MIILRSHKRILVVLFICLFFIPYTKAYDLFLDVNVSGLCTIVKIYKNKTNVIWNENFLTPELLMKAKKENIPQMMSYLNTIRKRRLRNKVARLKLERYIKVWNKTKSRFSKNDIFRFSSLIFVTALKNI